MERKLDVADNKAYSFLHEVDRGGLTYPTSLAVSIASTVYRVVTVLTSHGIDEPFLQISNQVFRAVFWLLYGTCTQIQTAKTDNCHAFNYRRKLFENCPWSCSCWKSLIHVCHRVTYLHAERKRRTYLWDLYIPSQTLCWTILWSTCQKQPLAAQLQSKSAKRKCRSTDVFHVFV